MIAKHYRRAYSVLSLRVAGQIGRDGVNLLGVTEATEHWLNNLHFFKISIFRLDNKIEISKFMLAKDILNRVFNINPLAYFLK
jgi:hypothetical protein